jgi:hypothetical protein
MSEAMNDIKRIRTTFDLKEANKALEAGWTLINVAAGQDETNFPITQYTLGSKVTEAEAKAAKTKKDPLAGATAESLARADALFRDDA